MSHWNDRNVCPATVNDRYSTQSRAKVASGATPAIARTARAMPLQQKASRAASLALINASVGNWKYAPAP